MLEINVLGGNRIGMVSTMPIRLSPKASFVRITAHTSCYLSEECHRCRNMVITTLYPRVCQTSSSTFQMRRPALLTSTPNDSKLASSASIVNNMNVIQGCHTPLLTAPPSSVVVAANMIRVLLSEQLCTEVSNRSIYGSGLLFS